MKPREKVVTAEDIQSSLYFIHVNQPEDVRLVEPPTFGQEPPLPSNPVARKAVPGAAPPGGLAPLAPRRKPVPGTLAPVNDFENRQNIGASNYSQNLYPGHGPEYSQRTSFESGNYAEPEERPPLPPRMPTGSPAASTTLTLIRRDPASDSQWNVAYIEDPPVYDLSSSTLNEPMTKNKYGAPFYIEVTNPGYSKFLNNPEKQELLRQSTELSNRMSQLGAPSANYNPYMPPSIPATSSDIRGGADQREETFRRRVWMEGSKHRSRSSHDFSAGRDSQRSSGEAYSGDFRVAGPPSPMVHDDKQPGFRGYVFKSPWNGRCEFITGVSGDTLKVSLSIHESRRYSLALIFISVDISYPGCRVRRHWPCP